MRLKNCLAICLCISLLGCQLNPNPATSPVKRTPSPASTATTHSTPEQKVQVLYQAPELKYPEKEQKEALLDSKFLRKHNELALKIFQKLHQQSPEKNLLFSPLLLTTALITLYNFGSESTRQNIAKLMEIEDLDPVQINQYLNTLNGLAYLSLPAGSAYTKEWKPTNQLEFSIWLPQNANVNLTKVGNIPISIYKIPSTANGLILKPVFWLDNFSFSDFYQSSKAIFTSTQTMGFHWTQYFLPEETKNKTFSVNKQKNIQIPMMHLSEIYIEDSLYSFHEYPELKTLTAGIDWFLPGPYNTVSEKINEMSIDKLQTYTKYEGQEGCYTSFPKFKLTSEIALIDILKILNISEPEKFLEISKLTAEPIQLNNIKFPLSMNVDENGGDASQPYRLPTLPPLWRGPEIFKFEVNRPFFFVGQREQIIYLMGVVNDPSLP